MTMSHQQEKWPVDIFRYSIAKGWEFYQQPALTRQLHPTSTNTSHKGMNKNTNNGNHIGTTALKTVSTKHNHDNMYRRNAVAAADDDYDDDEGVTVTPRYGCIEVKKLRLRIHLFEKYSNHGNKNHLPTNNSRSSSSSVVTTATAVAGSKTSTNRSSSSTTTPNNNIVKVNTTVIRRRDRILLSNRKGLGAVVLKFKTLNECMTFMDRLIELNKDYTFNQIDDKADQLKQQHNMQHQQQHHQQDTKRIKLSDNHYHNQKQQQQQQVVKSDKHIQSSSQSNSTETDIGEETNNDDGGGGDYENIRSYIVRLLHDRDFLSFVDTIEKSLESTPDCSQMLKALEYPRRSHHF